MRNHGAIDWQLAEGAGGLGEERVQDLLRQDELDRRGSCNCDPSSTA
jgi:hypothetical protein